MDELKPRVKVPQSVSAGELMEIRTMVSHKMETGYRRDTQGKIIPRHIIDRFTCEYAGQVVFDAEFGPGIAANPYVSFYVKAVSTGPMTFTWRDDRGETRRLVKQVEVVSQ